MRMGVKAQSMWIGVNNTEFSTICAILSCVASLQILE